MMCAWNEFLMILPHDMRNDIDQRGKNTLEELRLRINAPPELILGEERVWLTKNVTAEDLNYIINAASRYSPWAVSSISQGYLSAAGGHRIGICGEAIVKDGHLSGIREVQSLCIRIARDFSAIIHTRDVPKGSVLILGAPGWGKTTLLRDLIRQLSKTQTVAVVDERKELFPSSFYRGRQVDVLTGCPKAIGIEMLLRTMGPEYIAVDEITAEADCQALIRAANCGVKLLATAHASSVSDFLSREIYRPLVDQTVFDTLIILRRDKSYFTERMNP